MNNLIRINFKNRTIIKNDPAKELAYYLRDYDRAVNSVSGLSDLINDYPGVKEFLNDKAYNGRSYYQELVRNYHIKNNSYDKAPALNINDYYSVKGEIITINPYPNYSKQVMPYDLMVKLLGNIKSLGLKVRLAPLNYHNGHSEPLSYLDNKHYRTKLILLALNDLNVKAEIITHNDLIGHNDYSGLCQNHNVKLSILSLNRRVNKLANPTSASLLRLIKARNKLTAAGVRASINFNHDYDYSANYRRLKNKGAL